MNNLTRTNICGFILGMLLIGCSTTNDDKLAQLPVKIIQAADAGSCQFMGPVFGSEEMSYTEDRDAHLAYQKAAQQAVDLGANAAVIQNTGISKNGNTVTVQMNAYRCD